MEIIFRLLGLENILDLQLHFVAVQRSDASDADTESPAQATEKRVLYAPIVVARATNLFIEGLVTDECTLGQLKVEVSSASNFYSLVHPYILQSVKFASDRAQG